MSEESLTPKDIKEKCSPHSEFLTTVPDPSMTPHGQCSICRKLCYDLNLVGKQCHYTNKKDNRRCFGTFQPYAQNPEGVNICGDKVIQFSNAVRKLADLFDAINILDIKEGFLMGQKLQTVEAIIERQRMWQEAIDAIRKEITDYITVMESNRKTADQTIGLMHRCGKYLTSAEFTTAQQRLESFVNLCDRLEKHQQNGTLKIVAELSKEQP